VKRNSEIENLQKQKGTRLSAFLFLYFLFTKSYSAKAFSIAFIKVSSFTEVPGAKAVITVPFLPTRNFWKYQPTLASLTQFSDFGVNL